MVTVMAETNFYPGDQDYIPVPEAEGMVIREWAMEPGDAVAFNFRTLHGARGNSTTNRRRAFSLRLVGDDARYVERPGPTSPPFPGHAMVAGQRLREDWFPLLWPRAIPAASAARRRLSSGNRGPPVPD